MSEAVGWIGGVEWGGALWPVGGPGWRGRLISHAPQLGRMVMALSCPRSTRHAPTAPLTRGSGASCRSEPGILSARTLRGSDSGSPVAEEKPDGSEAMAAAHPAVHEAGMVGDHATLVSPSMARAAAPWWGEPRGTDGFFVDEPLPRWVACCCCSSTRIHRAGDANPTKPPGGRHGGVYRGRWSRTNPSGRGGIAQ